MILDDHGDSGSNVGTLSMTYKSPEKTTKPNKYQKNLQTKSSLGR